jgi:hypothetical protein
MFRLVLSFLLLSLSQAHGHGEHRRNRHLEGDQQDSVCGTPPATDEQKQAAQMDFAAWRQAEQAGGNRRLTEHMYDIDVWFHWVAPNAASANRVTATLAAEYLVEFNKSFQGTAFQFALAGEDTTIDATMSNNARGSSKQAMQVALHKGGSDTMNVYFDNTASSGLASLPPTTGGRPGGNDFNST